MRDAGFIVDALTYDVLYGGNSATVINARAYHDAAVAQLPEAQRVATAAAYAHLATVVAAVVTDATGVASTTPTTGNASVQVTTGTAATGTEGTVLDGLLQHIEDVITAGNLNSLPAEIFPNLTALAVSAGLIAAANSVISNRALIINRVIQSVSCAITNYTTNCW